MKVIDQTTWSRAAHFAWFRAYEKPHYAVTSRLDVTQLVAQKATVSPYRACLWAIGSGLHAVPELLMRFRDDVVVEHDKIELSMSVPNEKGSFNYAYVPYDPDFASFDLCAKGLIAEAAKQPDLKPISDQVDAVAFLSCMPWLDYTSINNALPGPDDCIPRVTWGKFVQEGDRWRMAMTLEVHHALVDGAHVGAYFEAVQKALSEVVDGPSIAPA